MANIRDLKKDINYVLGDIIETVYIWEVATDKANAPEGQAIIDEAIQIFDELMEKVNDRSVENKKAHLKSVRVELEEKATALVEKVNQLS